MEYLNHSSWVAAENSMKLKTIVSTNCLSAGEALRLIDREDVIKGDFILVTGDTVSNMDLAPALDAHRRRREKDKHAILTMVGEPFQKPLNLHSIC